MEGEGGGVGRREENGNGNGSDPQQDTCICECRCNYSVHVLFRITDYHYYEVFSHDLHVHAHMHYCIHTCTLIHNTYAYTHLGGWMLQCFNTECPYNTYMYFFDYTRCLRKNVTK